MTQADLVRLYFNKENAYNSWDYCFNQQCPLALECAHYLSVTYKKTGTDQRLRHLSRCLPRQQVRTFPAATDDENGIRLYEYS
jgi:hypothetical protein